MYPEVEKGNPSSHEESSKKRAWWTLGVLTFVAMVDFADRSLMGAVAEPIRLEFSLSDTELGILMGFAFSLRVDVLRQYSAIGWQYRQGPFAEAFALQSFLRWRKRVTDTTMRREKR